MKKYTFTITVEEVVENNVVNSIIAKVIEEDRIKLLVAENNNKVVLEMKKVLEVIYADLTELLKPLNLTVCSHFRNRGKTMSGLDNNHFGKLIDIKIGGNKEHSGTSKDKVVVRLYCPFENGKLTFRPKIVMFEESYCAKTNETPFTTSENLIETFSEKIEKMYRNNK